MIPVLSNLPSKTRAVKDLTRPRLRLSDIHVHNMCVYSMKSDIQGASKQSARLTPLSFQSPLALRNEILNTSYAYELCASNSSTGRFSVVFLFPFIAINRVSRHRINDLVDQGDRNTSHYNRTNHNTPKHTTAQTHHNYKSPKRRKCTMFNTCSNVGSVPEPGPEFLSRRPLTRAELINTQEKLRRIFRAELHMNLQTSR